VTDDDECVECTHRRSDHYEDHGAPGAGTCEKWFGRSGGCPCPGGTYDDEEPDG
jgi:hypothetical protein